MAITFKGGINFFKANRSAEKVIKELNNAKTLSVAVSFQGSRYMLLVKKGELVDKGQRILSFETDVKCPVHASVSGKVIAIEEKPEGLVNITIENDFENRISAEVKPFKGNFDDIDAETVIEYALNAGICEPDGTPTCSKIKSAMGKINTLIVNCIDPESCIESKYHLMLKEPDAIIGGMKLLLKALNIRYGDIVIDEKKTDAVRLFGEKTKNCDFASVTALRTKYPKGEEGRVVYSITERQIPTGGSSLDIGAVVFDAQSCAALYNAFVYGMPALNRIVSVSGDLVKEPLALLCPVGTKISDIIEFLGVDKEIKYIIDGGTMSGKLLPDVNASVTKTTASVVLISEDIKTGAEENCIRCGRCVVECPRGLMPNYLAKFAKEGKTERCLEYNIMSCIECGSCSYICPAKLPITDLIRSAKSDIKKTAPNKGGYKK